MTQELEILIKPNRTTMGITITPTRVSFKFRSEEEKLEYMDRFLKIVDAFLLEFPNTEISYRARLDLDHLAKIHPDKKDYFNSVAFYNKNKTLEIKLIFKNL